MSHCQLFGAAAYYAQLFEESLADFLVAFHRLIREEPEDKLAALEKNLTERTMGQLLDQLKHRIELPDAEILGELTSLKDSRNDLMHHFFRRRKMDVWQADKQLEIVEELATLGLRFKRADAALRGMILALGRAVTCED